MDEGQAMDGERPGGEVNGGGPGWIDSQEPEKMDSREGGWRDTAPVESP